MELLRKTFGRGYRLARVTAQVVVHGTLPPKPAPKGLLEVTQEEGRFLHMLMSRNKGYARARGHVPSLTVNSLRAKRLVTWEQEGDGFAIAMTPLGFEMARRRLD